MATRQASSKTTRNSATAASGRKPRAAAAGGAPPAEPAAAFVFEGTVLESRAATMSELAGPNTLVVQVDRLISAPAMFQALAGQQVTLRTAGTSTLRKGSRKTFRCNGWIFGASVALDVVAIADVQPAPAATLRARAMVSAAADDQLQTRLDSARLVVAGQVAQVAAAEQAATRISEHDPEWHDATIRVDEVVKGQPDTKEVTVLFPRSDDVRWRNAPKYAVGEQGVWLLQPGRAQATEGIAPRAMAAVPEGTGVMTTLHPCDFLPLHELERIKSLVGK